jgi:hypothetical protein
LYRKMTPETHPPSRQCKARPFLHLLGNRLRKQRRINRLSARKVAMPPQSTKRQKLQRQHETAGAR